MKDRAIRRRRDIDAVAESEDCYSLQRRRDKGARVKSSREMELFLFFYFYVECSSPPQPHPGNLHLSASACIYLLLGTVWLVRAKTDTNRPVKSTQKLPQENS